MDETALAFEAPYARAVATGGPLDRISVRDYTRNVEIGAFASERGVTQRIRFNVVLEVSHHAAARDDDVDQVISYDTITQAIEAHLSTERVNLLETLAERVAERVLADPRAVRIFVRIEKLDRIPGALGVEIVRSRLPADAPKLRPVAARQGADAAPRPWIICLSPAARADPEPWLEAVAGLPVILCLPPRAPFAPEAAGPALRIGLLSVEQAAWDLVARAPRCEVVATRTELDWALRQRHLPVWAPSKMVLDAPRGPERADTASLAHWLGAQFAARDVLEAGGAALPTPADLARALRDG